MTAGSICWSVLKRFESVKSTEIVPKKSTHFLSTDFASPRLCAGGLRSIESLDGTSQFDRPVRATFRRCVVTAAKQSSHHPRSKLPCWACTSQLRSTSGRDRRQYVGALSASDQFRTRRNEDRRLRVAVAHRTWASPRSRSLRPGLVARKIRNRLDNVVSYCTHGITNAVAEDINSKIQSVKSRVDGYRNKENYKTAVFLFLTVVDSIYTHTKP